MKGLATFALVLCLCLGGAMTAAADSSKHEFRVGLVLAGNLNDPINQLVLAGLERAGDRINDVDTSVVAVAPFGDAIPSLTSFAAQGYDLVIANGFFLANAVGAVATQFTHVHFVLLDAFVDRPNVESVFFKEQESGGLVGVIAGMLESTGRAPKNQNTISAIGVKFGNFLVPAIAHYIAGYRWGAQLADPSITVLIDYTGSFAPGPFCTASSLANDEIARGADIIFPVAGGCGNDAVHAAGQQHVYSIGVDVSQKTLDPSVIVSAVKRYDSATYDVIKAAVEGGFSPGMITLGLNDEATGYTVDNFPDGKLPADIRDKVVEVEGQIEAGILVPPTTL